MVAELPASERGGAEYVETRTVWLGATDARLNPPRVWPLRVAPPPKNGRVECAGTGTGEHGAQTTASELNVVTGCTMHCQNHAR